MELHSLFSSTNNFLTKSMQSKVGWFHYKCCSNTQRFIKSLVLSISACITNQTDIMSIILANHLISYEA